MGSYGLVGTNVPREKFSFQYTANSTQSFENAVEKARNGTRLTVDDAVELLTTGSRQKGIDLKRKEKVLRIADCRRREVVGEEVTFVANLNNNITTACNTGCLFCNFKDRSEKFRTSSEETHAGFTKTPSESRNTVAAAVKKGIYEVTSVSGLHPALALDTEHLEILEASTNESLNYSSADKYEVDPGTYAEQIAAMNVGGVHIHSITPEEAHHAQRGANWDYKEVYRRLADAGLDSVPGTAAEILVDEVRAEICPAKIDSNEWLKAMSAAAAVGLDVTSTIMYGHLENERHRAMHLKKVRDLQDQTNAITEFVPLSFVHHNTPLHDRGIVTAGATDHEDELMIAVSRLFLDNIDHIQSSWVKYGDSQGLKMLNCGADDFMGTILSEEITKRAGGGFGEHRSFTEYVEMIRAIGRIPTERSTDYRQRRRIVSEVSEYGPKLGPQADGTPLVD